LINFVDATNDANHYTKPPSKSINHIYIYNTGMRRKGDCRNIKV